MKENLDEMAQRIESNGATKKTTILSMRDDSSSINSTAVQRWSMSFGIALATFHGILFTTSNFLVQYFKIGANEIVLVRSVVHVSIVGLIAAIRGTSLCPAEFSTCTFVAVQAFLTSLTLYLTYR